MIKSSVLFLMVSKRSNKSKSHKSASNELMIFEMYYNSFSLNKDFPPNGEVLLFHSVIKNDFFEKCFSLTSLAQNPVNWEIKFHLSLAGRALHVFL